MEVLKDFAYQLPTRVMCDMLGVEEAERTPEAMQALTQAIADSFIVFETRALSNAKLQRADEQMDFLYDYFGAGFETTAHMIGNGLLTLKRHPGEWAKLLANPGLATNVVEEVLRFESSLQATYRTALVDAEVAGTRVAAGQRVLCIVGGANRDPQFVSNPDVFDITRQDLRIMSFGGGIHQCIGQQLARLEGRIAFAELVRRMPDIEVDVRTPAWRSGFLFRGLMRLDARW